MGTTEQRKTFALPLLNHVPSDLTSRCLVTNLTAPSGIYDMCKGRYTLSVKLSDFTVWLHTRRKNWVNCAVLTGNSTGIRTVLSSRLSRRELRSSIRESHSFLSLLVHCFIDHSHTYKKTHRTDKKLIYLMGNLCCAREHSVQCNAYRISGLTPIKSYRTDVN